MIVRFYHWLMKEPEPCQNCELLRSLLETEKFEKKQMLETILNFGKAPEVVQTPVAEFKPILPNNISWKVRRQMLEQEDREKAKLMREKEKEAIDNLEKELKLDIEDKEKSNGANRTV